jgi:hypothetical protein
MFKFCLKYDASNSGEVSAFVTKFCIHVSFDEALLLSGCLRHSLAGIKWRTAKTLFMKFCIWKLTAT